MTEEEFKKAIKVAYSIYVKFEISDTKSVHIRVSKINLRSILERKDFSKDIIYAALVDHTLFIG